MTAITLTDLTNAKLDVDHIAELATSNASTATDRNGNVKTTWAGIQETYPSAVTVPSLASEAGVDAYAFGADEVQSIVDNALPQQSYASLRAYTGRALGIRITTPGLSGFFQRAIGVDASADNGGTIIVDAVGRRWRRLFSGAANVKWFGAKGDGISDDYPAIQACLNAHDRIWIPGGNYLLSAGVRGSRVVQIEADKNAALIAAPGFSGVAITKVGQPFVLKALIAVFSGDDVGQQLNPRLGEVGGNVYIGPVQLHCNEHADYGLLVNSCPGVQIYCHAFDALDFGIWAGPNCWGGSAHQPRILRCVNGGIYFGEACNGAAVYMPEIYGVTRKTGIGVLFEGTQAGTIGAIGNVKVEGGYIEDCKKGAVLKGTGSMTLLAVDIESIDESAVVTDCSAGGVYGHVNVLGCQLASLGPAFFNRNAYINVQGTGITDGAVLDPYYSDSPFSLFKVDGTLHFTSGAAPTPFPEITSSKTILASYETPHEAVINNKRLTNPNVDFSRSWSLFNMASDDQPREMSTGLEFRNSRFGGSTSDYRGSIYNFAQVTTSDPSPRAKKRAGLLLDFTGAAGSEEAGFHPEEDNDISLGTQSYRWKHVYGVQYHAAGPGGVDAPGVTQTFPTADGKTVTVRGGIITSIA